MYNITYRDALGFEKKYEGISENEWRFIRASCHENGWEVVSWEKIK